MSDSGNLSYIHNVGKEPLRYITLGNLLQSTADRFPGYEGIVCLEQQQRLTFKEILEKADALAAGLSMLGLERGDMLGIWAPNLIEWYITNMACVRLGLVKVSLNPSYQALEMEYCLNKVGITAIVCPHKNKYCNYYDILTELAPELTTAEKGKLDAAKIPSLKVVVMISEEKLRGTYSFNEVMKLADENNINIIKTSQHLIKPDDPCYIQFTSGTTGRPKAAVGTHFKIVNNAYYLAKAMRLGETHHKICVPVPFYHVYGAIAGIIAALHFGATIVIPSSIYNVHQSLLALKEESCSIMFGTPTVYIDVVNLQTELQLSINLQLATIAGSVCPQQLVKKIKEVLKVKRIAALYGMTESWAMVFATLPADQADNKVISTIGHVSEHWEVKVVNENGDLVSFGNPGELYVRGYSTMLGYWQDEVKTNEILEPNGWLKTGDRCILQKDGYGRIIGRLDDVIIRGGENIYPKEIEEILSTHPYVLDVQVIGLPHHRLGEQVCACIRLQPGTELTFQEMLNFCKTRIAFSKIPSQLKIIDEFPKTSIGKIQRSKLREQIIQRKDNLNE